MRECLKSRLVQIGLGLLVFGCGPLLCIIGVVAVGLWPDPHLNPIGPGLLAFFTFWPSVICILVGVARLWRARRKRAASPPRHSDDVLAAQAEATPA
jgi:hypothetical protein